MERVTFIVTDSGNRITCLLNPEHLVQRRRAGLRRPMAATGPITGSALSDDVLLHTGGGRTEIDLDLLFDVSLAPETPPVTDVRQLTKPLWDLAENQEPSMDGARMTTVRFLWGKPWNVLAVVESVAERLERFDSGGTPTRSWLRMRLRRVPDPTPPAADPVPGTLPAGEELTTLAQAAEPQEIHNALSPGVGPDGSQTGGERLDELAARYYGGRSWLWRLIAAANGLDSAPWAPPGAALVIPEPPTGAM
ncbi:hypothetical protein GCM10009841_06650 [Microlunatus panaciterrae]